MLPKDGGNRRSQAYAQTRLRLDSDQSVFRVYKGVKTFDYNRDKNLIVTGGKLMVGMLLHYLDTLHTFGTFLLLCHERIVSLENAVLSGKMCPSCSFFSQEWTGLYGSGILTFHSKTMSPREIVCLCCSWYLVEWAELKPHPLLHHAHHFPLIMQI